MDAKLSFKEVLPFEKRQEIAGLVLDNHPDKLPVILEKAWRSQLPDLDKKSYAQQLKLFLVPNAWSVWHFVYLIQDKLKLSTAAGKPIFLFVKNMPLPTATLMSTIYEEHKDLDGFLYMTYSEERCFGCSQV